MFCSVVTRLLACHLTNGRWASTTFDFFFWGMMPACCHATETTDDLSKSVFCVPGEQHAVLTTVPKLALQLSIHTLWQDCLVHILTAVVLGSSPLQNFISKDNYTTWLMTARHTRTCLKGQQQFICAAPMLVLFASSQQLTTMLMHFLQCTGCAAPGLPAAAALLPAACFASSMSLAPCKASLRAVSCCPSPCHSLLVNVL